MNSVSNLDLSLPGMPCQMVRLFTERPPKKLKDYYQHSHPTLELQAVTSGSCTIFGNGTYYSLQKGQLILIPPGFYHQTKNHSPDCTRITLTFSLPSRKQAEESALPLLNALKPQTPVITETGEVLGNLLQQLNTLAKTAEPSYSRTERLRCLITMLLLELGDHLSASGEESASPAEQKPSSPAAYIIDEFLGRNFQSNNGCRQLADRLHVSPRHLNRIIQDAYGMNYREKLKEIRLAIAVDFLTTTDMSIAKIAELLGYSSAANFSTFVKHAAGRTPSAIRQAGRLP